MNAVKTILIAFASGLAGAFAFHSYNAEKERREKAETVSLQNSPFASAALPAARAHASADLVDLTSAAAKALPGVVYINSISKDAQNYTFWDMIFEGAPQTQVSSGSGVIFSSDGYIVTNNHVISTAENIQVIYNKRSYEADLIGTDPSTDLAVLKIKESNLPALPLGDSKNLAVGEWVMAVGNPFSLSSTATVGIVSAKGRRINVVQDKFPIESFIQTDAAINPGNSGGALVNSKGELVGINTAIFSRTGSYTGYAFAVPVDIVRKVVNDLIKYGIVQKAIFGAAIIEYDYENADRFGIENPDYNGVLVANIDSESAAEKAGLKKGDIIVSFNNRPIDLVSAFEEELSYRSPGDKITFSFKHNNKLQNASLTLLNRNGESSLVKRKIVSDAGLGASMEAVNYGVKVFKLKEDGVFKRIGVPENFTIYSINRKRVKDPQEVINFFNVFRGQAVIYGMNSSQQEVPLYFTVR